MIKMPGMTKKVLICGATGFIGRNMAEAIAANGDYEAIGVYHERPPFECENLTWIQADLTDPADVDRVVAGCDIIIQAAATTSGSKDIVTKPFIHVTDNAVMNSLLFRSAFEHEVEHVVFFSCSVMYQSSDQALKETDFDESDEMHPRYFGVGWTKVYIEKQCEFYARIGETKYTAIRHSNIYGPHDKFDLDKSHVFGATITKVLTAEDKITVWGTGEEARDLLYVDDLVDFVQKAIAGQKEKFSIFNAGKGQAVSIKELVRKIVEESGKNIAIEHDLSQPTIKTSLFLDCTKAETELGWKPAVSLDEGIRKTIDWWRKHNGAGNPGGPR